MDTSVSSRYGRIAISIADIHPADVNDPALDPTKTFVPSRYYNITTPPQPELGNKTFWILTGHLVGGSSAVNGKAVSHTMLTRARRRTVLTVA